MTLCSALSAYLLCICHCRHSSPRESHSLCALALLWQWCWSSELGPTQDGAARSQELALKLRGFRLSRQLEPVIQTSGGDCAPASQVCIGEEAPEEWEGKETDRGTHFPRMEDCGEAE